MFYSKKRIFKFAVIQLLFIQISYFDKDEATLDVRKFLSYVES